jgi:hypothetical protein
VLIFLAIGAWSYKTGSLLAQHEVSSLEGRQAETTARFEELQQKDLLVQSQLAQQRKATDALQQKYNADVPAGAIADIVALARQKIASGVPDSRLKETLRAAEVVKPCAGRVVTRRFAIGTQAGKEDSVTFADGLIQVSALSTPTTDSTAKPVVVKFTRAGSGQDITASGLPVHQSIIIDNSELQFTVTASDVSGYVTAALTTCSRT